nr:angiopoietin-related protein 7-like [Pocillopora verrucosa]
MFVGVYGKLSVKSMLVSSANVIDYQKCRQLGYSAKDCAELYKCGERINGVYSIDPDGSGPFKVYCDQTTAGGGWTVFQRRLDGCLDFNRDWADYKHGFGNFLIGEYWLGLDKIYRLTQKETENRLRVDLGRVKSNAVYAEYSWFKIGDEKAMYQLNLGNIANATVHDSLEYHNGSSFGTRDKVNEHCVHNISGGWWYVKSTECAVLSNLNGAHQHCGKENKTTARVWAEQKIHWGDLAVTAGETAPTTSEMKIKTVDFP